MATYYKNTQGAVVDKAGQIVTDPNVLVQVAGGSTTQSGATQKFNELPSLNTKSQTISDLYKNTGTDEYSDIENYLTNQSNQVIDEDKIYRDATKRFQKEIDATNQIYAEKLAKQKQVTQGNLGSQASISARAGIAGSPIGEAQFKNVQEESFGAENLVLAEQSAAINAILGKARKDAVDEIAAKRIAKESGTKDYINFLKEKQTRKQTQVSNLAKLMLANNVDPSTLDQTQLDEIAKSYGVKANDIKLAYSDATQLNKKDLMSVSEGQTVIDPNTGKVIFQAPKTYKPSTGGGSIGLSGGQYADDLDAIIGTTLSTIGSKFGQETFSKQLARTRNEADKLNLVASQVLKNSDAATKSDFRNQAIGVSNIEKAIAELDAGTKTGVINNAGQYLFNVFGKDFDPRLAKINGYITSAIQPYRNSVTGAAWGSQEDSEYQSLFGSTKYSPAELRQRLVQVKEILKAKSAEGLNAFVNPLGYYDNQFASGTYAPDTNSIKQRVESVGYDYEAMKADGLSDEEIINSLQ